MARRRQEKWREEEQEVKVIRALVEFFRAFDFKKIYSGTVEMTVVACGPVDIRNEGNVFFVYVYGGMKTPSIFAGSKECACVEEPVK